MFDLKLSSLRLALPLALSFGALACAEPAEDELDESEVDSTEQALRPIYGLPATFHNVRSGAFGIPTNGLMINALNGARHLAPVVLNQACTANNLDCQWIMTGNPGQILSARNTRLALNAFNGAKEQAEIKLWENCDVNNKDCLWEFVPGATPGSDMIRSVRDPSLFLNAWGGARDLAPLKVTRLCTSNNPDCWWGAGPISP